MTESLASDFEPVTYEQWVEKATGGEASVETVTRLEDGIEAKWLYTSEDALAPDPAGLPREFPFVRGNRAGRPWQVRQECARPDRPKANSEILEDLMGGATEVTVAFDLAGRTGASPGEPEFTAGRGQGGVAISTLDDLSQVLEGVFLDIARVALDAGASFLPASALLAALWKENGIAPGDALGSFRADPLGAIAREGTAPWSPEEGLALAAALAVETGREYPNVRSLGVDTTPYADAGATAAWELAIAIATGAEHLRACSEAGLDPGTAASQIEFTLSIGPDQFLEMSKFRAIRRLWSRVLEECGVEPDRRSSATYGKTSGRMTTWIDPWVNMLRVTTATFAAGAGGADGITVTPFDRPIGEPGPLGRRIARNTQTVVQDEAFIGRIADPLAGSWYGESLTDQLAEAAWERFREIERGGGQVEALKSGAIAATVADLADRREEDLLHRRQIMTGVNEFPLLGNDGTEPEVFDTAKLARLDADRLTERPPVDCSSLAGEDLEGILERAVSVTTAGARIDEMTYAIDGSPEDLEALTPRPDAAPFEVLRKTALDHTAKNGETPRMFLACMGPIASHVQVANWAKNFFECGGIETIQSGALAGNAEQVEAFKAGGFTVAAVCVGRDSESSEVADLVAKLREAGASWIYLAGADADTAEAAGADEVVGNGVDMMVTLAGALGKLGVK
jgi:methylmalonyl-CoA mutase